MFLSLVSGSSGNASIIKSDKTTILVDCGLSGKKLTQLMQGIGISPSDLDAILVTHEHQDHTTGIGVVSRRFNVPVFATKMTHEAMNLGVMSDDNLKVIKNNESFEIGDVGICPFSVSHDAKDPVCYSFFVDGKKYSVATDTGVMNEQIFNAISGSEYVMLEANYDEDMLVFGNYPYELKKRIKGDEGHLSNKVAAKTAVRLINSNTKHIMLSHLSDKNNRPDIAYKTVENEILKNGIVLGRDVSLCVANRYEVTRF